MTQSVRLKLISNLRAANNIRYSGLIEDTEKAKVVVFPAGQASVFLDAIKKINFSMDYILPFPFVFIQFSEAIKVDFITGDKGIGALILSQEESAEGDLMNRACLIAKDLFRFRVVLWSDAGFAHPNFFDGKDGKPTPESLRDGVEMGKENYHPGLFTSFTTSDIKNLAIACIGYINCENIYLERQGEVAESINAKRERKGKSRLEPYYVCRIRGVQYDSAGNEKGEGVKHGIRYDVRGHFRRMTDGRTTWVRPHQRGLANELYIPKTYVVDKKVTA